jgi:hypothetical protein
VQAIKLRIKSGNKWRVEEAFGWMKTIGGLRKTRYRGRTGSTRRATPLLCIPQTWLDWGLCSSRFIALLKAALARAPPGRIER